MAQGGLCRCRQPACPHGWPTWRLVAGCSSGNFRRAGGPEAARESTPPISRRTYQMLWPDCKGKSSWPKLVWHRYAHNGASCKRPETDIVLPLLLINQFITLSKNASKEGSTGLCLRTPYELYYPAGRYVGAATTYGPWILSLLV